MDGAGSIAKQTDSASCPCCGQDIIDDGSVRFDLDGGFVVAGGRVASLTPKQAEIFYALWNARPRTVSQEQLLETIYWRGSIDEEPEIKIIDVYVCKTRAKLRGLPVSIQTVWGKGYRMMVEQSEAAKC